MKRALYWLAIGFGLSVVGLFGLLLISSYVFRPYWIASGSMKPTLLVGDYIFVDWSAYLRADPQRGDVVVHSTGPRNVVFVDRIIGMPGDTVAMKNGTVIQNGQPMRQQDDGTFMEVYEPQGSLSIYPRCSNFPLKPGDDCAKEILIETTPEIRSYGILNIVESSPIDSAPMIEVPKGQYFVLGDNRDNSLDNRTPPDLGGLGLVPRNALRGRLDMVIFSSHGQSIWTPWTWRQGRWMETIQ